MRRLEENQQREDYFLQNDDIKHHTHPNLVGKVVAKEMKRREKRQDKHYIKRDAPVLRNLSEAFGRKLRHSSSVVVEKIGCPDESIC